MSRKGTIQQAEQLLRSRLRVLVHSMESELDALSDHHDVRDSIDQAIDEEYESVIADLAAIESYEVREIKAALDRIHEGRYGKCDDCGKQIPNARLKAIPYATRCVKCQDSLPNPFRSQTRQHWEGVEDYTDDDIEVPSLGYQELW